MSMRNLFESAVGMVGRTGVADAKAHVGAELRAEFKKIVKKIGGKTVARQLLAEMNAGGPLEESDSLEEQELSPLQKEYRAYFQALLAKYEVSSPASMDEETMKKFFNEVSAGWVKGKGAK